MLITVVFLVRMLREELQLLQEQGSYVGEVVKPMDKKKVLVKVGEQWQNVHSTCLEDITPLKLTNRNIVV